MRVSFHPEAKSDLRGSYEYYRGIDPELARGFIEEYRKALAFVKSDPLVMRTFYKNDRRVLLKRFKTFALIYEGGPEGVRPRILAKVNDPILNTNTNGIR